MSDESRTLSPLATPRSSAAGHGSLVDLHLHTTHSDGRRTPTAVVELAAARGLETIAVVDHDVVSGLEETFAAGQRLGIEVIPGIELTAHWEGRTCHVLGYGFDQTAPRLLDTLQRIRVAAEAAVIRALDALHARGYDLTADDLGRYRARYPTPTTLLLALVQRRLLRSRADLLALLPLLRTSAPGLPLAEAIALVHDAGGAAVLAHPGRRSRGRPLDRAALTALSDAGLDGVEVDHPAHDAFQRAAYAGLARELGLIATEGSDWHGRGRDPLPGSLGGDCSSLGQLRAHIGDLTAARA